ncbi:hypothetical protein Dimus_030926 [Dionaea muscipula]
MGDGKACKPLVDFFGSHDDSILNNCGDKYGLSFHRVAIVAAVCFASETFNYSYGMTGAGDGSVLYLAELALLLTYLIWWPSNRDLMTLRIRKMCLL